jgi:hypothetical protein
MHTWERLFDKGLSESGPKKIKSSNHLVNRAGETAEYLLGSMEI